MFYCAVLLSCCVSLGYVAMCCTVLLSCDELCYVMLWLVLFCCIVLFSFACCVVCVDWCYISCCLMSVLFLRIVYSVLCVVCRMPALRWTVLHCIASNRTASCRIVYFGSFVGLLFFLFLSVWFVCLPACLLACLFFVLF